jgi:hypothetical protein
MPRMQVKFEMTGQDSSVVDLNSNSNIQISEIETKDYPTNDNCVDEYHRYNGDSRQRSCWKFRHMPHLTDVFPYFVMPTLPYQKYTMPGGEVLRCENLDEGKIVFLQRPYKNPTSDHVWIRPSYKFYPGLSGKSDHAGKCNVVVQSTTQITEYYTSNDNNDNWPKYEKHSITFKPLPNIDQKFVTDEELKVFMTFPCVVTRVPMGMRYPVNSFEPFRQLYTRFTAANAETSNTREFCPDYVSEACFKNVYAFYGRPCTWVKKQKFLFSYLRSAEYMMDTSDADRIEKWARFRSYGSQGFDFDLASFKLQVRRYQAGVATRLPTRNVEIADTDIIEIAPEDGYSCDGCIKTGATVLQGLKDDNDVAPGNKEAQYIPLLCRDCLQHEAVAPNTFFPSEKPYNRCEECGKHEMRNVGTPSQCQTCSSINEIYPMRVFAQQRQCTACMHVQYFDAGDREGLGCIPYVSVSDFISFGADGVPIFTSNNGEPRDECSETGLKENKFVVKNKQYRNFEAGQTWKASSKPQKCEPYVQEVLNSTARNLKNATRNTEPKQLHYIQWCGHHEIHRQRNALLQKEQKTPFVVSAGLVTLQTLTRDCPVGTVPTKTKEVMLGNRTSEFKCINASHAFLYEIRREGQRVQCTVCPGITYTKHCWPTYHPSMSSEDDVYFGTPNTPSPGTCQDCEERCPDSNHYLNTSLFSCWSNGTARISGGEHGRLDYIGALAAQHMNYWYKPAECSECPRLDGVAARRPALVTRCGNKVSFEMWHPDDVSYKDGPAQPTIRVCCAVPLRGVQYAENSFVTFVENVDAYCITKGIGTLECEPTIPDLATETQPYCPPGWYVSEKCVSENENAAWTPKCCSKCEACSLGFVKTPFYEDCPGDTFYDTQTFGCKAECLSGNYLDGDTCIPCETCMK